VIAWIGETIVSAVCGLIVGLIVVGVVLLIGRMLGKRPTFAEGGESPARARA